MKFAIATAQSTDTCAWSGHRASSVYADLKQAAARSPRKDRGPVAVDRFLREDAQIGSPSSSSDRAVEDKHLDLHRP